MIRIKLATGDRWTFEQGQGFTEDPDGGRTVYDECGRVIDRVGPGQWVYVEIPPEAS